MKVILLGFDGMTLNILKPYIKAGVMPNFAKVLEEGSYGILRSTIPPITGPGWTSMFTGKNPGRHGVFEFFRRNGYKKELLTRSASPGAEPFWNILSKEGKRMLIANVPFTYPPDNINGIIYSGLMTPGTDSAFTSPPQVKEEILGLIPDYRVNVDEKLTLYSQDKDSLLKQVTKITEDTRTLMNHFMNKDDWEVSFITFTGSDVLQHFWWDEIVAMHPGCVEIYKMLDDSLGDMLKRMDDETVLLIASDHGFAGVKKAFHINNFLSQIGLLHFRRGGVNDASHKANLLGLVVSRALRFSKFLDVKKNLPGPLVNYIKRILPLKQVLEENVDWEKTKAFAMAPYGSIAVNMKGREPKGIVEREDVPELFEQLKKELLLIKDDDTGKGIIKEVLRGDQLYLSNSYDDMPDFLVVMNDGYSINIRLGQGLLADENMLESRKVSGDHNINGMFAAYGNIIKRERLDAEIYDIMPTILYLMGAAIPEDTDGRVLTEILDDEFVRKNEIRFEKAVDAKHSEANALSDEEAKIIEESLKNLGYMD